MISACVRVQFLLAQRQRERERERHAAFDPNYVLYISRGKQAPVNRSVNAPVATSGKNTSVNTPVNTLLRISKNKAATPAARDFNRCTPFFCLASGQPFSSMYYMCIIYVPEAAEGSLEVPTASAARLGEGVGEDWGRGPRGP